MYSYISVYEYCTLSKYRNYTCLLYTTTVTFAVQLVILVWFRIIESGVSLLIDQQVGKVDLFEFEFDWL